MKKLVAVHVTVPFLTIIVEEGADPVSVQMQAYKVACNALSVQIHHVANITESVPEGSQSSKTLVATE